jgi:hypothetical protein
MTTLEFLTAFTVDAQNSPTGFCAPSRDFRRAQYYVFESEPLGNFGAAGECTPVAREASKVENASLGPNDQPDVLQQIAKERVRKQNVYIGTLHGEKVK